MVLLHLGIQKVSRELHATFQGCVRNAGETLQGYIVRKAAANNVSSLESCHRRIFRRQMPFFVRHIFWHTCDIQALGLGVGWGCRRDRGNTTSQKQGRIPTYRITL